MSNDVDASPLHRVVMPGIKHHKPMPKEKTAEDS
jgi:hypothetical protein